MRVLVATDFLQGKRDNDFCFTKNGELVQFGFVCDGGSIDDRCGCSRSFSGVDSHKGTTTALVVNLDITEEDYKEKIRQSLVDSGWAEFMDKEKRYKSIEEDSTELLKIASNFVVGTVLEKRGQEIQVRGGLSYARKEG